MVCGRDSVSSGTVGKWECDRARRVKGFLDSQLIGLLFRKADLCRIKGEAPDTIFCYHKPSIADVCCTFIIICS